MGRFRSPFSEQWERVFDQKLNVMVREGEWLIRKGILEMQVLRKEGIILGELIFERGKGTLYVTNRRIAFLLTPTYMRAAQDLIPMTLLHGIERIEEARELKKRKWKEFVEVELSDVADVTPGWGCAVLRLHDNRLPIDTKPTKYQVTLMPKKKALALLGSWGR